MMTRAADDPAWPDLPFEGWKDTYETLHLWSQIVGKVSLALAPPLNHCWGIAMRVTARGVTTPLLPYGTRSFTIEFDFVDHRLIVRTSDGALHDRRLEPRSVAAFYRDLVSMLDDLSLPVKIWPVSVEMADPVRLDRDEQHGSYDPEFANRFWRILVQVNQVFAQTRCSFIGKCSPVHFFWGSFDLAVTRFSGRRAPAREGPAFMRDAYSHEVISHGFWPGSGPVLEPAFYAYAVPEPAGLKEARIRPSAAAYHTGLGEFILPYAAVRVADAPAHEIAAFVDSTYDAAATLGNWNRKELDAHPSP